jgi:hypothetical protein
MTRKEYGILYKVWEFSGVIKSMSLIGSSLKANNTNMADIAN